MTDELDRLVLGVVGDDFVTLDHIIEELASPRGRIIGKLDPELLHGRLVDLVADKLISAYLLHAEPPYITPVEIRSGSISSSWFYITQRGRKCLASAGRASHNSDARGEDRYTPAVNF